MSRNDSTVPFFIFLVGIGVGATAVILLGSKRIDQLRDEIIEVMNDGVKELKRRSTKNRQHCAAETGRSNRHRGRRLQQRSQEESDLNMGYGRRDKPERKSARAGFVDARLEGASASVGKCDRRAREE